MRLDDASISLIRTELAGQLGPSARVRLFGSRVDDTRRGGDVDLLVELDTPVDRPIWTACLLEARISRALGGRKVDVLLAAPNIPEQPIHRVAGQQGVLL